ncbi:MAG: class I SAM-dependent methyltransferase [Moorea sp. SIOASIH]|uniref:class I SAM-dependent methyltransferase n=1 Tax=Moorena sp. SIOASIH TaxID=2607817 RepID=UPI0013B6BA82|nr:class I SAM-dependent methyltransferase [Moorena sp. SIOASIH]NEO36426.1 class I SAM-dependent methyltransferase [Moorena sp. SIOASIH]
MVANQFTEADTEAYYDNSDERYRISWHPDGSKHWGYFDNLDDSCTYEDFAEACERWNQYMLSQSQITADSRVLEIGSGNGNAAIRIAQQKGCEVVGVDLSTTHINNATEKAKKNPSLRLSFHKASATDLPFDESSFTHVWSQATLYHIHQRQLALQEIYRVLQIGGIFAFDDLVTPVSKINISTQKHLYERLIVNDMFTPDFYKNYLTDLGFKLLETMDLSKHMQKCYQIRSAIIQQQYPKLSRSYQESAAAVEAGDVGWWFFLCEKLSS